MNLRLFFTFVNYSLLISVISNNLTLSDNKKDKSYFPVEHNQRKRNRLRIILIVVVAAAAAIGLFFMSGSSLDANQIVLHNHVQLNVTYNGQHVVVPAQIGITMAGNGDTLLYGDHSLDKYGMTGMSPLHTHDTSGIIHVESNTIRNFTL